MKPSRIPNNLSGAALATATSIPLWKRRQKALRSFSMIVSRQNQKIKDIRRLRRCKDDRAILEGPHLVREALRAGLHLEFVLTTPEFAQREASQEILSRTDLTVSLVDPALLDEVCDTDSPRGVVAIASVPPTPLAAIPLVEDGLYLFVDGLQDPGNLGALARSAEAFGGVALILGPGTVHPNHPRALRASAGSLLRLPVAVDTSATDLATLLQPVTPLWTVLTPRDGVSLAEIPARGALVLTIGAEGPGVSKPIAAQADLQLTIGLRGEVESLNATVAASIALYEISRSRSRA
jgi:TrmH family RNA methyltransferase